MHRDDVEYWRPTEVLCRGRRWSRRVGLHHESPTSRWERYDFGHCAAVLELVNRPDIQPRLQAEVDDVIGSSRRPSLVNEANMRYMEAFILETMRWHAVAPLSLIRQTTCGTHVGELFLPANTLVSESIKWFYFKNNTDSLLSYYALSRVSCTRVVLVVSSLLLLVWSRTIKFGTPRT